MSIKSIFVLGSTGSIGRNTLEVIRQFPDKFRVSVLTANSNINLIEEQAAETNPDAVVIKDPEKAKQLIANGKINCPVLYGEQGLIDAAKNYEYDILVSAIVGFAGLRPTIEGIKRGKRIALANKETLVSAGGHVKRLLREFNAEMIPVDSEHSAIFQVLNGEDTDSIKKIILTASGGPFFNKSEIELQNVTITDALNHPNWVMGNKITIDSATMMNKGLEVIEAHWLFDLPKSKIEVLIHPQSIVHSMVEFVDGSLKAQLSSPDMKLPIQYALTHPARLKSEFVQTDLTALGSLTFYKPDCNKFRCMKLAFDALSVGGTASCILNAANEVAVELFLNEVITFTDIPNVIEDALEKIDNHSAPDIETIFETDHQTREFVYSNFKINREKSEWTI